ncbi:MAG: DUF1028 domain-containing protein [Acidimicrobiia bacterium]
MTFSIVAHDPDASDGTEWGVAVASKFLAAGSVVPWASAGVGAIATQALANIGYGVRGLELLANGMSPGAVVELLTANDDGREHRQFGVVDARGRAATFTGGECLPWAGGRTGDGYACQGNILTGPEVLDAMVAAFHEPGDLTARLVAALLAGDRAGGDRRGRQSAAILIVREGGGYLGDTDVAVDLRVDDHPEPVVELGRLCEIHRLLFPRPSDLVFVPIDEALASEIGDRLARLGHLPHAVAAFGDEARGALMAFVGIENLEERWTDEPAIEEQVLAALRTASE